MGISLTTRTEELDLQTTGLVTRAFAQTTRGLLADSWVECPQLAISYTSSADLREPSDLARRR